uniref:NADH-ubiquinone oxidoreductase chain 2 n=1 Tax=Bombus sylvestris TaxID=30201 RepID=A0A0S2LT15_BOMSL|nr:NADH dehydrogenase subunit 2 [Bombus sylvestris]
MLNKFQISCLLMSTILFIMMINSSSIYTQWLSMEFTTMLLISTININSNNKIVSILYFMYSSISSLLLLIIISMNFTQILLIKNNILNMILTISMFLKIGMFPFCFWMIYIYSMSSWIQIFIISTFMKFIPIYFFSSIMFMTKNLFMLLIFNNIFISIYTNLNFSTKKLFSCSSIFNSTFFIFIIQSNKNLYIFLFMIYILIFLLISLIMEFYNINNLNFNNLPPKLFKLLLILIFMYSSFPMFITFMFKWQLIYFMNFYYSSNLIFLLLLTSMIMLWNYFILTKILIMKSNFYSNYMNKKKFYFNFYMLFILLLYSILFLMFNLI